MALDNSPSGTPVIREYSSALDLLSLHQAFPEGYPFFLESAEGSSEISRFNILLKAGDENISLDHKGQVSGTYGGLSRDKGFLDNLNNWQSSLSDVTCESELPFVGGWFIYLGYELVSEIEPKVVLPGGHNELPVALAVRCPAAVIHDKHVNKFWVIAESVNLAEEVLANLDLASTTIQRERIQVESLQESPPEEFTDAVVRIKEYILDGDVFQVNLSRRWQGKIPSEAENTQLYRQLRQANPAPFAGLMVWKGNAVLSSSPERLVETRGNNVQTRPIAGTRPRTTQGSEDEAERNNLVTHPKERAEHIMLIDLERNDLGRICEPGSVEVNELMVIESYTHVHHIVSNIKGRLREGVAAGDVIRAVFPGGTITGCPKVRCMEIIAELEGESRGYYTGAMGYLDRRGNMDLNILIRCLERSGNEISFRTGAGIVADSIPENELQETRAKALGLLRALNPELN